MYLSGLDLLDARVHDAFDPLHLEEHLGHLGSVAETADPEMSEIGLGREIGDLDLVLQAPLLHLVAEVEQELVRRAEARGALNGADDDGTGRLDELLERIARPFGVLEPEERLGMALIRPEARNGREVIHRPGGEHEVVVALASSRIGDLSGLGIYFRHVGLDETGPLLLVNGFEGKGDVLAVSQPEGKPDQRGHEQELVRFRNNRDLMLASKLFLEVERGLEAREVRSNDRYFFYLSPR